MGLKLNKPYLRAAMEADCQKIVRGQVLRSDVVAACLKEMKTRFLQAVSQASKLDDAVSKVTGTLLSLHSYSSCFVLPLSPPPSSTPSPFLYPTPTPSPSAIFSFYSSFIFSAHYLSIYYVPFLHHLSIISLSHSSMSSSYY